MRSPEDITTLNIDPQVFWGLVSFGGFLLACAIVFALMVPARSANDDPLVGLKKSLGMGGIDTGVFLIGAALWGTVFVLLAGGLIWLIWDVIWRAIPSGKDAIWDWRFSLAKLTALVATLGAVVALPITMQRLRLTRRQTDLTAEALFNDKVNAAAADLHGRRLITIEFDDETGADRYKDVWQDDIVKRTAAIDRFEGLARERPDATPRIASLLSVYLRELSRVITPDNQEHPRADMEKAAQTLGRLRDVEGVDPNKVPIDLRGANLQGFSLAGTNFDNARFSGAEMQGTSFLEARLQGASLYKAQMQGVGLIRAQMQGASLVDAQMQGANLYMAQLQRTDLRGVQMTEADLREAQMAGADLFKAQMRSADLRWAQMQGVNLSNTELQGADFSGAEIQGAALREVDCNDATISQAQLNAVFYDGSVKFRDDLVWDRDRPVIQGWIKFLHQWRAWQVENGFQSERPEGFLWAGGVTI